MLFRMSILGVLLLCAAPLAVCDTVVFQEDFSGLFLEHDWVYNNSGSNNATGYGGLFWPCKVDAEGSQILGYNPTTYYATFFDSAPFSVGPLGGADGWTGSAEVVNTGHSPSQSLRFTAQEAYKNVTGAMRRDVQWLQCYARVSAYNSAGYIYVGTADALDAAAVVRFNGSGAIEALDGDGAGGGSWKPVIDYVQNAWYRIRVKLDYAAGTYEVTVNRSVPVTGLGFRDSAASSGLNSVKFVHPGGAGSLYVDDLYAGNSPYAPGPSGAYWSDHYNRWCMNYGVELNGAYDAYDWMNCQDSAGIPVNTDPSRPGCYKAAVPEGWTAAFSGIWADWHPNAEYYSSGRGKMGFGPLMGAYAQSPDNRCLHMFSSHGDLRLASPPITSGPGVYTLSWRAGVWNGNTADPAMQYKWTDWCRWGFGYTNWCVWDDDPITTPPYDAYQVNQINTNRFWVWQKDPFHDSDPDGVDPDVGDAQHPAGEEPGEWHSFTRTFAFGYPPVKGQEDYDFNQEPGWFIGFNVGHAHDPHNQGYRWATICNVDDIVLTKKDPVSVPTARNTPVGGLVELGDMVIVNMVPFTSSPKEFVDIYLETKDRTAGMMVRVTDDTQRARIWDGLQFAYELGDVVNVVGAMAQDDCYDSRNPQPDTRNPVKYISGWHANSRLPAIVEKHESFEVRPVALSGRDLVGSPVVGALPTDGMLVTVFGRVNTVDAYGNTFYVDDGSGLPGYYGGHGVKIDCTRPVALGDWLTLPDEGSYAAITGTITAEKALNRTTVIRTLYVRSAQDIRTYPEL